MFENFGGYIVKLFFVLNPHLVVPFFLSATQNYTNSERKSIGLKMCLYAAALGLFFVLAGEKLLESLGVTLPIFRVGGGLLLGVAAWHMLYDQDDPRSDPASSSLTRADISLCPMAFPMLAGPATLTTLVGMAIEAKSVSLMESILVVAAFLLIIGITYALTLCGNGLMKLLGKSGGTILQKVGGILIIAMSLQMMAGGIKAFFWPESQQSVVVQPADTQ